MRITINKDLLEQALGISKLAVSKDAGQITSCVLVERVPDQSELRLLTTDNIFIACVPVGADAIHGSGKFAVEAARLSGWLSNIEGELVEIEALDDGVHLTCEDAKAFLASFDVEAFPDFTEQQKGASLLVSGPVDPFVKGLGFVRTAIGKETSNNEAANQFQIAEFKTDRFFASDTHVISIYDVKDVEGYEVGEDVFKVGKVELPKVIKFLGMSSVERFRCETTGSFYLLHGDDGSMFGFAIPQFTPASIPGLRSEVDEEEIWRFDLSALKQALGALNAVRAATDQELTLSLGALHEAGEGALTLAVKDVSDQQTCTVDMTLERERVSNPGTPLRVIVNIEWLNLAVSKFGSGEVTVGLNTGGPVYAKFHQRDEDLSCNLTTLMSLRLA